MGAVLDPLLLGVVDLLGFVGTFIARISKGRTIREFVLGVTLLPSAVSLVWFVIFGGTAINLALARDPRGRRGDPGIDVVRTARPVPAG